MITETIRVQMKKRRKRRRLKPIVKLWLLIIGLSVFIYAFWTEPEFIKKVIKKEQVLVPFEISGTYSSKLNDKMSSYIDYVEKSGVPPCRSEKELKKNPLLKPVNAGKNYSIDHLTHSHAYLSSKGKSLLDRIDADFGAKIKGTDLQGSHFIVSSLTRTKKNVRELKKVNVNASDRSAHMYGGCFDITYARFKNKRKKLDSNDIYKLKETIAEIIYQLMKEKKCWATKEKREPCFHVVSR
tara:strand:- start:603 stop:1322 length:720 start_codon:yes stop_codon:yes gene_type:complete